MTYKELRWISLEEEKKREKEKRDRLTEKQTETDGAKKQFNENFSSNLGEITVA